VRPSPSNRVEALSAMNSLITGAGAVCAPANETALRASHMSKHLIESAINTLRPF